MPNLEIRDGLPEEIRAGLHGMRLAIWDELLAAGPAGLSLAELRARTLADVERLGADEGDVAEALAWLREHRLLVEYQPGRYRGNRMPETGDRKIEETKADRPTVAQLRTPALTPTTRRGGQMTFC